MRSPSAWHPARRGLGGGLEAYRVPTRREVLRARIRRARLELQDAVVLWLRRRWFPESVDLDAQAMIALGAILTEPLWWPRSQTLMDAFITGSGNPREIRDALDALAPEHLPMLGVHRGETRPALADFRRWLDAEVRIGRLTGR